MTESVRLESSRVPTRSLWPQDSRPSDDDLTAMPSWGRLIDRWHYTVRCFIHPVAFSDPDVADFIAHRLILVAALNYRVDDSLPTFEEALRREVVTYVTDGLGPAVGITVKREPSKRSAVNAFLSLSPRDQLVVLLYDNDDGERSRAESRHEIGKFRPRDLARLLAISEGTLRTAAHRAQDRLGVLLTAATGGRR
jgi:hypothetical protein